MGIAVRPGRRTGRAARRGSPLPEIGALCWTRPQAEQVLARIDGVLAPLPQAVQQDHERIIGERPVANADKLLSLYERDLHVIVRGKAGAAAKAVAKNGSQQEKLSTLSSPR